MLLCTRTRCMMQFAGLPATLLLLLAAQMEAQQVPTAIKKMSLDEGEKILPEYLAYAPEPLTPEEAAPLPGNSSAMMAYWPPFGVHVGIDEGRAEDVRAPLGRVYDLLSRLRLRLRLRRRQLACPIRTESCEAIGRPNYCCVIGSACYVVADEPDAGNVGCCPRGAVCGGGVAGCTNGSTACPADVGGGCCIPGFVCAQTGCIANTVTVITITTVSAVVISDPTESLLTTSLTTLVVTVAPTTQPASEPSPQPTEPAAPSTATDTDRQPTPPPTAAEPAPTDGGASTTVSPDAPYRPTSSCPTGFYGCLARAGGGCCRTGRDCVETSCPPITSTTILSDLVTVAVPVTDVPAAEDARPAPTCAGGWYLCPTEAGPVSGCCPSGYDCGTASCTLLTTSATATVQKDLPSKGCRTRERVMGFRLLPFVVALLGSRLT